MTIAAAAITPFGLIATIPGGAPGCAFKAFQF
jgi:hypothetical protein